MKRITIGILHEGKIPVDKRTPLTPGHASKLQSIYPNVKVVIQASDLRIFSNEEYEEQGIEIVQDISKCDIMLGVKEVPNENLIDNKTYLFFSHTIKKQAYNRELLRQILKKKVRLIDYECLKEPDGRRIIAFGRYAGIVGAYNSIWTFGRRYNLFKLRRAYECYDFEDLKHEFNKVKLPRIKIALTGGGRVAKGAMEVLHGMNIRQVSPGAFISERFDEPVFSQLNVRDYNKKMDGSTFNRSDFYSKPQYYESNFLKYAKEADILIGGAFWDPRAPVLFKREEILREDFNIRIIADITCDIEGSIPSTKKPSTIDDPIYDYNPSDDQVEAPLSDEANITVMAVDNLPSELPRDSSWDFSRQLMENVLPHLIMDDTRDIIKKATIANKGKLTKEFKYLKKFVEGRE